jgi:hypothetical protein
MTDTDRMWPPQEPEEHARQLAEEPVEEGVFEYEAAPYGLVVQAHFPMDRWSAVFFSWLSFKGFVAGLRFCENTHLYATQAGARVWATFIVTFSSPRALGEWLRNGYPIEQMLTDLGIPAEDMRSMLVRDLA